MDEAEFDKFADEYWQTHVKNIRLSGEEPDFFAKYKISDLKATAALYDLDDAEVLLDFGCGIGNSLPHLADAFPKTQIIGLDVSKKSLDIAEDRFGDVATYLKFDGKTIPPEAAPFDIAFTACVFHHIPEQQHVALLTEINQAMRPGGLFMLFEHNPYNPLTVRAVNTCPFDENAVLIAAREMRQRLMRAGFETVSTSYRIFFPRFAAALRPIEPLLKWLPLGAQYSLTAIKKT